MSSTTADEFRQLLIALAASGPNAPKPTPLEKFFETHPIAKTFLTAEKPAPVSYATLPYFGVNSFKFTNAKGDSTIVRYQMEPVGDAQYLTKEQLAAAGPNYLVDEIRERVADGPVRMKLQVQVGEAGDKIEDPSIAWSDSRKTVELGVIEIDKVDPDSDAARVRCCSSRKGASRHRARRSDDYGSQRSLPRFFRPMARDGSAVGMEIKAFVRLLMPAGLALRRPATLGRYSGGHQDETDGYERRKDGIHFGTRALLLGLSLHGFCLPRE